VAAGFCTEESIAEGTTLCEEGARAENLYILEDGAVSIRFAKGAHYAIQENGKILGWSFLVPPNRYTASVVTIRPSRVLAIKSPDFYTLVNQEPKMGLRIMNNLAQVVAGRMKAFVDYY
jgi:CRP/FNR family transcriptional regulator, cyclic AMP receptor protein